MRFEKRNLIVTRRVATWLALAVLFFPAQVIAVDQAGAARRLDPLLKVLYQAQLDTQKESPRVAVSASQALETVRLLQSPAGVEPSSLLKLLVRFDGNAGDLEKVGFQAQSRLGPVLTGVLPPERLAELAGITGLAYVQLSRPMRALWEPMAGGSSSIPHPGSAPRLTTVAAGSSPGSGNGAIIGIVDTGVDIRHQDFRKSDGTTRIRYLLDLSDPGDVNDDGVLDGPDDFGGTLYTETEINQALSGSGRMRQNDPTGHGTHALSIAAGDDPNLPGIAPEADLIVVKATRENGTLDFESVDVLHALTFIDARAAELGLPYVINLSLGSLFGSHDGRSLEEIAIDSLVGPGIPGKSVVVAAGNSAAHGTGRYSHFQGTAFAGAVASHTVVVPPYSHSNPEIGDDLILLDIWYKGGDRLSIAVTAPDGTTRAEARPGEIKDAATSFGHVFIANMGGTNPLNGDTEALVLIYDREGVAPTAGEWKISVSGESVEAGGAYHAWLIDGVSKVGEVYPYLSTGDHRYLVGKPGAAYNAVTVGSFARHDRNPRFRTSWTDLAGVFRVDSTAIKEDISIFSSTGSTRDGRIKPDLVAPGEEVVGAMSAAANPAVSPVSVYRDHGFSNPDALILSVTQDRGFGILQGTSFAAPVVAGQIARILAVHPELDAIQVRNILINAVQADAWTGSVPNPIWGYGKLASDLLVLGDSPVTSLRVDTPALPTGWKGRPYNFTLTASGGASPYTWSLVGGTLPAGIEFVQGSHLTGTPLAADQVDLTFEVADSSIPQQIRHQTLRLLIKKTLPLEISTTHLPTGIVGRRYSVKLQANGGSRSYQWALAYGTPPPDTSLTSAGVLQGTPTSAGEGSFTVSVRDATGTTVLKSFTFRTTRMEVGEWRPMGSFSTAVTGIALDAESPDHLYAIAGYHQVSESFDAGATWRSISVNNGARGAQVIRVNPFTSDLWALVDYTNLVRYHPEQDVWVPKGDRTCSNAGYDLQFDDFGSLFFQSSTLSSISCNSDGKFRLYRSPDNGLTWEMLGELTQIVKPDSFPWGFSSLSVFRKDSRYMYAGYGQMDPAFQGFYRSTDGGKSWQDLGVGTDRVLVPKVSQKDPDDVIRSPYYSLDDSNQGVSVFETSLNGGSTWQQHSLPGNPSICTLERSDSNPAILLAGTSAGVFKSEDRGESWIKLYLQGQTPDMCQAGSWIEVQHRSALAIDSKNPNRMFVGTPQSMIYATEDGGISWKVLANGLTSRILRGVAISKTRPDDVMVTATYPYISRTNGERWTLSTSGIGDGVENGGCSTCYGFPMISPKDPDLYFFVGTDRSLLFRSEDRGISWTKLPLTRGEGFAALAIDPFDANILIARIAHSSFPFHPAPLWKSEDRGATWHRISDMNPPPYGVSTRTSFESNMAFASDVEGRIYALRQRPRPSGLFRSENRGNSWEMVVQLPEGGTGGMEVVEPAASDSRFVYVISDVYISMVDTESKLVRTTDFGYGGFPPVLPTSLAIDAKDHTVAYLGFSRSGYTDNPLTDGGIWKTSNGGQTWSRLKGFYSGLSVISLVAHPTDSRIVYAATVEDGVYRTTDGGLSWEKLDNFGVVADVVNVTIRDPLNPLALFAGTQGFGVQVSVDGGRTFVARAKGLKNFNVKTLAFDVEDQNDPGDKTILYAGTEQGLFKSTDAGLSWQATGLADGLVTDLAVDTGLRPRRIRLTTYKGGFAFSENKDNQETTFSIRNSGLSSLDLTSVATQLKGTQWRTWVTMRGGDGVAYSDDDGKVWHSAAGNGLTDRNVNDLVIEPGGRLWAAADSGVFTSDNNGVTWTPVVAGLPVGVPATSLSIDPNTEEVLVSLFSAENGGVYRGANLTGVWEKFVDGLRELRVNRLTNDGGHDVGTERGTRFYASTHGDGLYEVEVSSQEAAPPVILTTRLTEGIEYQDYREVASVNGGSPPYGWSVVAGTLPPGVTLDRSAGVISGRPVAPGLYPFTLKVVDSKLRFTQKELTLRVRPVLSSFSNGSDR